MWNQAFLGYTLPNARFWPTVDGTPVVDVTNHASTMSVVGPVGLEQLVAGAVG